jgi:hypothetical protein
MAVALPAGYPFQSTTQTLRLALLLSGLPLALLACHLLCARVRLIGRGLTVLQLLILRPRLLVLLMPGLLFARLLFVHRRALVSVDGIAASPSIPMCKRD